MKYFPLFTLGSIAFASLGWAEEIGSVDTAFKLLGPDHKIIIESFEDPKIEGVTCFVSRAKTGGISGGLGLAEDTSDASIACRQTGEIHFLAEIEDGEEVFSDRASIMFKKVRVVRFLDEGHNTLIYMTYSEKLIDGSPENSISAVAIRPWQ